MLHAGLMVEVLLRRATAADVAAIVAMLADDEIAASRESPDDLALYPRAFRLIDADPSELLAVAERDGQVVGTLQVSWLPGLSRRAALRAQVEGVRVARAARGSGLGEVMVRWAVDQARSRGCTLVQLTTDKARADARRFYDRLGFTATPRGLEAAPVRPRPSHWAMARDSGSTPVRQRTTVAR